MDRLVLNFTSPGGGATEKSRQTLADATAFVRRGWNFEIVDLNQFPQGCISFDVTVVRKAITRDAIRYIPGLRIFRTERLRVRARTGSRCDKAVTARAGS